ncbi:MAG: hypothetical protein AB7G37_03370 [Solirubrobacteraceae bacterium]
MSAKRAADLERRRDVRMAVYTRDPYCRLAGVAAAGPCGGPWTPHHLKKSGQGGSYSEANLVGLCATHNTWVEDNPDDARALGLVVKPWEPEPTG